MTTPASIEKPARHMTPEERADWLRDELCIDGPCRSDSECVCLEKLAAAIMQIENAVLDKIVQAGNRSASRGARHVAELAQSMKHKSGAPDNAE